MMNAVQGIIAAGTAAYLTREQNWEKIAFTSNHLFYLVGIASQAAEVEIPYFSLAARAMFMMTPIVLIEHFRQGQESTEKAKSFGFYFNRFYYAAAVVSTVVLVAFGHTAYGVGFFSVMALDMISRSDRVNAYVKTAVTWSAGGAALLTFASYAVKLATPVGNYLMGVIAVMVFLPRIYKLIQALPLGSASNSDDKSWCKKKSYPGSDPKHTTFLPYVMTPVGFISSHPIGSVKSGPFIQGLQSLTGNLPHDM
jgi:hypothetical protein